MTTRIHKLNVAIAIAAATLILSATSAQAVILGPYADGSGLHLWHFDETSNPLSDTGSGTALTMNGAGNPGSVNHAAFTGFGTSGRINRACCGNGGSEERGWVNGGAVSATSLLGSTTGAFTIETMLNFNSPLGNDFTEIFRNSPANLRGRIVDADGAGGFQPGFEFTVPTGDSPFTSAATTVNTGTWYHLAMVYDGNAAAANDVRIYFTEMDGSKTSADLLATFTSTNDGAYNVTDFQFGSSNGGQMNAFIDEFRISNTARAADDMMFGTLAAGTPEPSTAVLALLGLAGVVGLGRRSRRRRS